jgi:glycosyltransferase involved in cell wall biosynthesis
VKVAFVSQPGYAVLPPSGSLEIWTREVARRLADGHEVAVYASASPRTADGVHEGIEYRFIEHSGDARLARVLRLLWRLRPADRALFSSPLHPLLYWLRVALDIRRRGVDAVHVYNYSQAVPIIRRLNPGTLIALHMQCEWLTQIHWRTIERRLHSADVVIGCSEHITEGVRSRFPGHAHRCRTIYNGVEIGAPVERRDPNGTVTLLHVGRISPEKGHHLLVEALNDVVREHPQMRMVFVGEESLIPADMAVAISPDPVVRSLERFYAGSYLERIRQAMSPELAERTVFAGRVDHERTAEYYEAADIFVFPSLLESFGIPPIEAMAAGLPVISARTGGTVEVVVDGETGILVERDDPQALAAAIAELVPDAERRAALGQSGRARAESVFSWTRITEELERALAPRAPAGSTR